MRCRPCWSSRCPTPLRTQETLPHAQCQCCARGDKSQLWRLHWSVVLMSAHHPACWQRVEIMQVRSVVVSLLCVSGCGTHHSSDRARHQERGLPVWPRHQLCHQQRAAVQVRCQPSPGTRSCFWSQEQSAAAHETVTTQPVASCSCVRTLGAACSFDAGQFPVDVSPASVLEGTAHLLLPFKRP